MRNVALTGPSEPLSYQPSLSEKLSSLRSPKIPGSGPADHDEPSYRVGAQGSQLDVIDPVKHLLAFAKAMVPVIRVAATPGAPLIVATDAMTNLSRSKPALRNGVVAVPVDARSRGQ